MEPPQSGGSASSLDLSTDSESEEIFLTKDDQDDVQSDDDSLGLELSAIDRIAPSGRKTGQRINNENSDDDF